MTEGMTEGESKHPTSRIPSAEYCESVDGRSRSDGCSDRRDLCWLCAYTQPTPQQAQHVGLPRSFRGAAKRHREPQAGGAYLRVR